jgi:hypothetical protein
MGMDVTEGLQSSQFAAILRGGAHVFWSQNQCLIVLKGQGILQYLDAMEVDGRLNVTNIGKIW